MDLLELVEALVQQDLQEHQDLLEHQDLQGHREQ
jgi:hypothetical protein